MTLEEMIGQVRSGTRDPAGVEQSDGSITRVLNEGVRDVVLKTHSNTGRWTRNTVADTELYALPSDCVKIVALTFGDPDTGTTYPLTYTPDNHINIRNGNRTGTPSHYYIVNDGFGLAPIPSTADVLTIDGVKWPDAMAQSGDECPLPLEMHQLPVMFALYRAAFIYYPDQVWDYKARYDTELQRVLADFLPRQADEFPKIQYADAGARPSYFKGTSVIIAEPE